MNNDHLYALTISVGIYFLLSNSYYGWGHLIFGLLGENKQNRVPISFHVWIGWAFTLLLFQILYFVFPITAYVVFPVLAFGIAVFIFDFKEKLYKQVSKVPLPKWAKWVGLLAILLIFSGWLVSRAMLQPTNYDSGLYHFNKIRWINTYPIIPGLGNLHGRLAFNQSFFTYVAAVNFSPFFGHGHAIANSYLLLLTILTFIEILIPVLRRPSLILEAHPFRYLPAIFLVPVLGLYALVSNGLSSPAPDLASNLLQLISIIVFAQVIADWKLERTKQNAKVIFLGILSATTITIKLSNVVFATVVFCIVLVYAWRNGEREFIYRTIGLCAVIVFVWCTQSFVLSGAPLYPSTICYIPVDFAVPKEKVIVEANTIYAWAKQPGVHWSQVLGNWNWFIPWLKRISTCKLEIIYPVILFVVFLMLTIILQHRSKNKKILNLEWLIFFPSVVSLVYWFFSAPDPRFANALFFILSTSSMLLFLTFVQKSLKRKKYFLSIYIVFMVANLFFAYFFFNSAYLFKNVSTSGWEHVMEAPLALRSTSSGLSLYVPETGDQCWDSPLPSTPYFNPDLRLRIPGNMASGFTVRKDKITATFSE